MGEVFLRRSIDEATYGPTGNVLSFAADFTYYEEAMPENFAVVELRCNVVAEPASAVLVGLGLLVLAMDRRS